MTAVQLTLDQMERPLPEMPTDAWAVLYAKAANSATDVWGRRYYNDDEAFVSVIQRSARSRLVRGLEQEYILYGVRRTDPYPYSRQETVEQWFARLDESCDGRPGSYLAAWLLPLTQLAQLAGRDPVVGR